MKLCNSQKHFAVLLISYSTKGMIYMWHEADIYVIFYLLPVHPKERKFTSLKVLIYYAYEVFFFFWSAYILCLDT